MWEATNLRLCNAGAFGGRIELGDDLHRVEVNAQP